MSNHIPRGIAMMLQGASEPQLARYVRYGNRVQRAAASREQARRAGVVR